MNMKINLNQNLAFAFTRSQPTERLQYVDELASNDGNLFKEGCLIPPVEFHMFVKRMLQSTDTVLQTPGDSAAYTDALCWFFSDSRQLETFHVNIAAFNDNVNLHCSALFRAQIHFISLLFMYWSLPLTYCPLPPPSAIFSQHFSQQPQKQIWLISIYGTCVVVACLITGKQAVICPPIRFCP